MTLKDADNYVQCHLEDSEDEINVEAKVKRCWVGVTLGRREGGEEDVKLLESVASTDPEVITIPIFPWFGYSY